jgi:hypothetical protein
MGPNTLGDFMRTTLLAAAGAAALAACLAGCGSSGGSPATTAGGSLAATAGGSPTATAGGSLAASGGGSLAATAGGSPAASGGGSLSADAGGKPTASAAAPAESRRPADPPVMALGRAVRTVGDPAPANGTGGGVLEITPRSVVYLARTEFDMPKSGRFVVVTMRLRSMTAVAATETAPISGGGWKYTAPDGRSFGTTSGNAANVTPDGFGGGGAVDPGTYQSTSEAFDIAPGQVGGTLYYKDGDGVTYRWKLPAADSGPDIAEVKKSLG